MPKFSCPLPDCTFETENLNEAVAAMMLTIHANATHTNTVPQVSHTKLKKFVAQPYQRKGNPTPGVL